MEQRNQPCPVAALGVEAAALGALYNDLSQAGLLSQPNIRDSASGLADAITVIEKMASHRVPENFTGAYFKLLLIAADLNDLSDWPEQSDHERGEMERRMRRNVGHLLEFLRPHAGADIALFGRDESSIQRHAQRPEDLRQMLAATATK